MRNALLCAIALFALAAGRVAAADLSVMVRGDDGAPLADAVVLARPPGGGAAAPGRYSWPMTMSQHNIAFDPYVLIVPVGSDVAFPNKDKVRHHVYSFSAAKKFELKLYGQQEERTVHFDKTGVVALGCNIHDSMIGYIYVTDAPFAAKTNAAGEAVLHGVPAGAARLEIWHPDMKARAALERTVNVAGNAELPIVLDLKLAGQRRKH